MKRWLHSILLAAAAGVVALSSPLHAADATTITGCLESTGDHFTLAADGQRLELDGAVDFAKHQGHTVAVTGEKTGDSFVVASIEHVSTQCDAAKAAQAAAPRSDSGVVREHDGGATADDQGGGKADRELTARIRKAIVQDDSLSLYAHNIKIITQAGRVTVRGPVRSTQEKAAVVAKAEAAAGQSVVDELTVQP
jgi:osmotically-inducible protein OsmY